MDSKGRFRREFVAFSRAGIRCIQPLGLPRTPIQISNKEGRAGGERDGTRREGRSVTDAVVVGDDEGVLRMYDFSKSQRVGGGKASPTSQAASSSSCDCTVRWQVKLEDRIMAPERVGSAHAPDKSDTSASDTSGEAITALLYEATLDELVVASAGGSVNVLDASTGKRLAKLAVNPTPPKPRPKRQASELASRKEPQRAAKSRKEACLCRALLRDTPLSHCIDI